MTTTLLRRTSVAAAAIVAATTLGAATPATADSPTARTLLSLLDIATDPARARSASSAVTPVPPSQCEALYRARCYGPPQINRAYGIDKLHRKGLTGKGRTVLIPIPFHNPHLARDVAAYSRHWGLPEADLEVLQYGDVPTADPAKPEEAICAAEGAVDVQAVHAIAPHAKIIVVETPTNQLGGTRGLRDLIDAIGWATRIRQVDAVSMSWGAYEHNFSEEAGKPGDYRLLTGLRAGLRSAYQRGTTLIAASGNTGPTGPNYTGTVLYPHRSVAWPASDSLVTAVGGTRVNLDDRGRRREPDQVWTDEGGVATGAGISAVFPRPAFQDRARHVVGDQRGSVDLAMNGSGRAREWFYSTYNALPGQQPGWIRVAGTSIAAPKVAGMVALAAQRAGHRLGDIRPLLYTAPGSSRLGLYDLTTGNNTANGVPGFPARRGYDLPSGVGTVGNASRFVEALAAAART
ncbi:S8 family serine peptidase [Actinomadura viridis]|uniref:S53 family peptidase n=1 Tax=Actinomadura viridis TaxID=58110 RepID=UPI003698DD41